MAAITVVGVIISVKASNSHLDFVPIRRFQSQIVYAAVTTTAQRQFLATPMVAAPYLRNIYQTKRLATQFLLALAGVGFVPALQQEQ